VVDAEDRTQLQRGKMFDIIADYGILFYAAVPTFSCGKDLAADAALIRPYKLYVQQVADWLSKKQALASASSFTPWGSKIDPVTVPELLLNFKVFASAILQKLKITRQL
jgi:hypothetical protein